MNTHANYVIFDDSHMCKFVEQYSKAHSDAYEMCMRKHEDVFVFCLHDMSITRYRYNSFSRNVDITTVNY